MLLAKGTFVWANVVSRRQEDENVINKYNVTS